MGRSAQGFRLRLDPRTKCYTVQFTAFGRRFHRSTHERSREKAARVGEGLYAAAILGGPAAAQGRLARDAVLVAPAVAGWLDSIATLLDETTAHSYSLYATAQWIPRWTTLDEVDRQAIAAYVRERLGEVLRRTLVKELSGLRSFLRWCKEAGHISEVPVVDQPPRRAVGTADTSRELKRKPIELDSAEIEAIIAELPEWSDGGPGGPPFRVRARFILAWETALRPATLAALRAPEDYRKGAKVLTIREEADKAREGRDLELSARARAVLEAICPAEGTILGAHACTGYLRAAARKAAAKRKLFKLKAEKVSAYDFRHARLTHLAEVSGGDLPSLMQLAGHKHAQTTSKYVRAVAVRQRSLLERAAGAAAAPAPLVPEVPTEVPTVKAAKKPARPRTARKARNVG